MLRFTLVCGAAAIAALPAAHAQSDYAFWTVAGRASVFGTVDGTGSDARFSRPWGIAVDNDGNIIVSEAAGHTVRKVTRQGVVTTIAGQAGTMGAADGFGTAATFGSTSGNTTLSTTAIGPFGVAVDVTGTIHVADGNNHTLRQISNRTVIKLAGTTGRPGYAEGTVTNALFSLPLGVAADRSRNLYIADTFNHVIRRISPTGAVTTIAGLVGRTGATDGIGALARFLHPVAIAVAPDGNLYVADSANTIRRLSPLADGNWLVTTIAGAPMTYGTTDGIGAAARFGGAPPVSSSGGIAISYNSINPAGGVSAASVGASYRIGDIAGLAVDRTGNIFATDYTNNTIRKITPAGVVTTIGGLPAVNGSTDGVGSAARFQRPCGIAIDADGTLYIAEASNNTIRGGAIATAPVIEAQPSAQTVSAGSRAVLSINARGAPPPKFQWFREGVAVAGATDATLAFEPATNADGGTYTVSVTNALGTVTSTPVTLAVIGAPAITTHPENQSVRGGDTVTLSVAAVGFPGPTYQWTRNGEPLPGQTNNMLTLIDAQDAVQAEYRVVVTNAFGAVTSNVARVTVDTGRIVNLSIRSTVDPGAALIGGFVISGGSKPLLIRAVGPTLRQFGLGAALADPQLRLEASGRLVATNDNWSAAANSGQIADIAQQSGAFALAAGSLDAAALATIADSAVTAQVTSTTPSAAGVALLEIYATGGASRARLVNVSTRASVGTGENALFAGFTIGGNTPRTLLIRAIGPTLGAFGVTGALSDPLLEVFASGATTPRAINDNWNGDTALTAAFVRVSAFPLPSTSSRDAALIVQLEPGSYSARISGVSNTTGDALLEIYELP